MTTPPIKVLVVEDNPAKKRKLFEKLGSLPNLFCEPDVVGSTSDAIKRLRDVQYDLMILDLFVPFKAADAPDEQNSIDLLSRIDSNSNHIKRPHHVLLISSAANLPEHIKEFARGRPWGCIQYSEDSEQVLGDIEHIAEWIQSQGEVQPVEDSACDIFIISALEDPEFTALEQAAGDIGPLIPLDSSQLVRQFHVESGERRIKIAAGFAQRMGPVASAVLCTKAILKLKPKLLLMNGICGAIGDKADIGDVIAADASWDWQSGKFVNEPDADFYNAPHQLNIPTNTRTLLIQLKREESFWGAFARDAAAMKAHLPKLVLGPMATGASVVADERITKKIREEQNKNVVALDMETYAVYAAAASANYSVGALSLKAVCDRADREKNDEYQAYAAKISATCLLHFIRSYGDRLLSIYEEPSI